MVDTETYTNRFEPYTGDFARITVEAAENFDGL
jgi:hypothetical protein